MSPDPKQVAMQRAFDANVRLGPAEPEDPIIRMLKAANAKRRPAMQRRWIARAKRLLKDAIEHGYYDAEVGSKSLPEIDAWETEKSDRRNRLLIRLVKLSREYIP